jgi:hypothetical protein
LFGGEVQPLPTGYPLFGSRFFTYQLVDHRTDSFYSIGKQYGTKPGFYLVVGPSWNGTAPAGIADVGRSSTDLAAIFPRVFQDDTPEDKGAIQSLLNQIMVYPLTEFDGKMKTKDWSKAPSFPAPAGGGDGETKWVIPEKFFDQLPEVLQAVPPLPGEEAMYGQFKSLLDATAKDPHIKATLIRPALIRKRIGCRHPRMSSRFTFGVTGRRTRCWTDRGNPRWLLGLPDLSSSP